MSGTLTLYHSPGACSLATHIALEEAGAEFETVRVIVANGDNLKSDYLAINPHARVPALGTSHGVITENIAILNFIADVYGREGSVPRGYPYAAARCNELLAWFASTVHISFATIWRGSRFTSDNGVWPILERGGRDALAQQFDEIDSLCVEEWLAPGGFSAADSYALLFLRWAKRIGFDIGCYPQWTEHAGRVLKRPAVQRALEREGLKGEEFQPTLAAA
jgi:glutathione S-transferase